MLKTIVIIIVMVVINLLMIFTIIQLKNQTSKKIKKVFLDKTGSFKVEYDKQNNGDLDSSNSRQTIQQNVQNLYLVDDKNKSTYKDSDFKENYRIIKEKMNLDKVNIVLEVIDRIKNTNNQDYKTYSILKLSNELTFDTVFDLSTVNKDDQISILRNSFDEKVNRFFDDYLEMVSYDKFNVINFYNYVIQEAKICDNNIYVKTGWRDDDFNHLGNNIVTVYDEDIIEGIKIVYKDKIYDYSV